MNDGLTHAYQLVVEGAKEGTVDAKKMPKPDSDLIEGGKDKAKGQGTESPAAKSVKVPIEMKKESNQKEIKNMLPESKFDKLFKTTLVAEDSLGDENPLEKDGSGEFNDEQGDFPPEDIGAEDSTDDEVDVATELRMIIDRLTEIAEKIGAYAGEEAEEGEPEEAGELDGEVAGDGAEELGAVGESVTYGKGGAGKAGGPGKGKADGKLGKFPDTLKKMTSKGSMKVAASSVMAKQTAKGKASTGGPGKGSSGKLENFPNKVSQMQSKGNMVVKGEVGKAGRSIFD